MDRSGLLQDLFDYWTSHIDEKETHFYESFARRAQGPILELASGAGRLLLSLKKQGLDVEGVESSRNLREECAKHARVMGLERPIMHDQKIEELSLKKPYALIYVALGSFQLISNRADAELSLEKMYRSLGDGGKVLISLFYPWSLSESSDWRVVSDRKEVSKGLRFIRREKNYHDPVEQCIQGRVRSEVWQGTHLLKWQERELSLRWYSHYEFRALLEKVGFQNVVIHRGYESDKPKGRNFMIFEATK